MRRPAIASLIVAVGVGLWSALDSTAIGTLAGADLVVPASTAYRAGLTLTVWISVRNVGPAPVVLDGPSPSWWDGLTKSQTLRATSVLDGGDGRTLPDGVPFRPVVLWPGDGRILGLQIESTNDVRTACALLREGTSVGLDAVLVGWHRLSAEHEIRIPLEPVVMMAAPTAADCGR